MLHRTNARAHEPLLENTHAPDRALIEKFPYGHKVRLRFVEWKLLLEGEENTLKYLPVGGGIGLIPLEMQVNAATAQLGAEIPKRQQLICSQQNVHGLGSIGYRLDDV